MSDQAQSSHTHTNLSDRLKHAAFADWRRWAAWREWLHECVPDTAKEVWNLTVTALLLWFLGSLVNAIAGVRWRQLQEQQHAKMT